MNASGSGFARGLTFVGPTFDEGLNHAAAGIRYLWDGDKSYDQELDYVREKQAGDIAEHPFSYGAGYLGGAVVIPAKLMQAVPKAFGLGAGSIAPRLASGSITSGLIGGTDTAIRSGGDVGQTIMGTAIGAGGGFLGPLANVGSAVRSALTSTAAGGAIGGTIAGVESGFDPKKTAIGAGIGAGVGMAGPVAGSAIGGAVRYAKGAASDALSGLSRPAQRFIENTLADPAAAPAMRNSLDELGENAVLADVSPAWMGIARGAASQPTMRDRIVKSLMDRADGAPTRLRSDADRYMGPRVIPSQIDAGLEAAQGDVGKLYGPLVENAGPVDTGPIAKKLEAMADEFKGPAQAAIVKVRGYLDLRGKSELDPSAQGLHATREAIDRWIDEATNDDVVRALRRARTEVDEKLGEAVPGIKEVDARFHELARQRKALNEGRPILSNEAQALRPEEVQQKFEARVEPQGLMIGPSGSSQRMRDSVRGEFDRIVGTSAHDATELKKTVQGKGDWSRDKLEYMYGPDNAKGILGAIDREVVFGDTAKRVSDAADAAATNGFGKFLDEAATPKEIPAATTFSGLALKGTKAVANSILRRDAEKAAARYAEEIGGLSVATGAERDAVAAALMGRSERLAAANDPRIQAVVNAILQSSARQLQPAR